MCRCLLSIHADGKRPRAGEWLAVSCFTYRRNTDTIARRHDGAAWKSLHECKRTGPGRTHTGEEGSRTMIAGQHGRGRDRAARRVRVPVLRAGGRLVSSRKRTIEERLTTKPDTPSRRSRSAPASTASRSPPTVIPPACAHCVGAPVSDEIDVAVRSRDRARIERVVILMCAGVVAEQRFSGRR